MFKKLFLSMFMTFLSFTASAVPSDFGVNIFSAITCNDKLDMHYYYTYFKKLFGEPYKKEQGAYWFKSSGASFYSHSIEEVFISDGTSDYVFVGVLLPESPDTLSKSLLEAPLFRTYKKRDSSQYSTYYSNNGSQIVWQESKSKMFCMVKTGINQWGYLNG